MVVDFTKLLCYNMDKFSNSVRLNVFWGIFVMENVTFSKEPGMLYDLGFLFVLNFNKQYCLEHFTNPAKASADAVYLNTLLKKFSPIEGDFRIFFELSEKKNSFISTYYLDPHMRDCFAGTFSFKNLQQKLLNVNEVSRNLAEFYLKDRAEEAFENGTPNLKKIDLILQGSALKPGIQVGLYSFFIKPETVLRKLAYALVAKYVELEMLYKEHENQLKHLQENFEIKKAAELLKNGKQQSFDILYCNNFLVSFSLVSKNFITADFFEKNVALVFGFDYLAVLAYLIQQNKSPDFELFGSAISEPNRIKILNYLLEEKEAPIKLIEQEFNLTGTNAYYHLSLMIKSGIVKTRNSGRTVLYSVNTAYFRALGVALAKYM